MIKNKFIIWWKGGVYRWHKFVGTNEIGIVLFCKNWKIGGYLEGWNIFFYLLDVLDLSDFLKLDWHQYMKQLWLMAEANWEDLELCQSTKNKFQFRWDKKGRLFCWHWDAKTEKELIMFEMAENLEHLQLKVVEQL